MKRVCIFGANGYLGRHLAKYLSSQSQVYSFELFDLQNASRDGHVQYQQMDVRNMHAVSEVVGACNYIFYFSGLTGTTQGFENYLDFVEINEIGLLNVLDVCRRITPKPKIIFPSSRLVYKGKKDVALQEDDEKEFKTIYALNKYAGERYLQMYADCFGIKYTAFRICVPYGSLLGGEQSYGTLSHFIAQAKDKGEVVIFGDGSQKRTLIHIKDLVRVMLDASINVATDNDVFNIGGADALTIRYVAERIAAKYGARVSFAEWPSLAQKVESGDTIFNSTKLERAIRVEYTQTFDNWLEYGD